MTLWIGLLGPGSLDEIATGSRQRFWDVKARSQRREDQQILLRPLRDAHRKREVPDPKAIEVAPFLIPAAPKKGWVQLGAVAPQGYEQLGGIPERILSLLSHIERNHTRIIPGAINTPNLRALWPPELLREYQSDVDAAAPAFVERACREMRRAGVTEDKVGGWAAEVLAGEGHTEPGWGPKTREFQAMVGLASFLCALRAVIPVALSAGLPLSVDGWQHVNLRIVDVPRLREAILSPDDSLIRKAVEDYIEQCSLPLLKRELERRLTRMTPEAIIVEALPESKKVEFRNAWSFLYLRAACGWQPTRGKDGKSEFVEVESQAVGLLREVAEDLERSVVREDSLQHAMSRLSPHPTESYRIREAVEELCKTKAGRSGLARLRGLTEKAQKEGMRLLVRAEWT